MEKRVFTVRKTFSKGSLYLTEVAICGETEFPVFGGIFDIKGQDERAQYIRRWIRQMCIRDRPEQTRERPKQKLSKLKDEFHAP